MYRIAHTLAKLFIFAFALIGIFLTSGYVAVRTGLTNTSGVIDDQSRHFLSPTKEYARFPLAHTPEWVAFRQAVAKDKGMIEAISKETGVPPRTLIAVLVPEQMRLFHSDRPLFKKIFEPLKILGSQSQFSWGVFGIKDKTARATEAHLLDTSSPFYIGGAFEHALDFKTTEPDQERFARIVDEHDHSYAYRYAALYVAQINAQWKNAGYPINDRPEILATLWNLGFEKSRPHASPQSGGALLDIDGTPWSFGSLAGAFYYSDEMIEIFPAE